MYTLLESFFGCICCQTRSRAAACQSAALSRRVCVWDQWRPTSADNDLARLKPADAVFFIEFRIRSRSSPRRPGLLCLWINVHTHTFTLHQWETLTQADFIWVWIADGQFSPLSQCRLTHRSLFSLSLMRRLSCYLILFFCCDDWFAYNLTLTLAHTPSS